MKFTLEKELTMSTKMFLNKYLLNKIYAQNKNPIQFSILQLLTKLNWICKQ